jgi:pantothenate kinase
MNLTRLVGLSVLLASVAVVGADAQSLKARQRMESEAKDLDADVQRMNETCGTTIAVKFDWAGAVEDKIMEFTPEGYCNAALSAISQTCGDPTGKSAVKEKIKSMTCGFAAERSMTLKDGAADYKINFNSSNDQDYVYSFLQDHL